MKKSAGRVSPHPRMYEISYADICNEKKRIQEQSTARWDALLAGLTFRVHALPRRAPLAVARRDIVRQRFVARGLPWGV
jgi:hypothetical protein